MSLFETFRGLLPKADIWALPFGSNIRKFFAGLSVAFDDVREYLDLIYEDTFPQTTRNLAQVEEEYGILPPEGMTEAARRDLLEATIADSGGTTPQAIQATLDYIQPPIYVHEYSAAAAFAATVGFPASLYGDPDFYTRAPLQGKTRCTSTFDSRCSAAFASRCDDSPTNDPGYFATVDGSGNAQPAIPDSDVYWPFFLFFGGEEFPSFRHVATAERQQLLQAIQQKKPGGQWAVTMFADLPMTEIEGLLAYWDGALPTTGYHEGNSVWSDWQYKYQLRNANSTDLENVVGSVLYLGDGVGTGSSADAGASSFRFALSDLQLHRSANTVVLLLRDTENLSGTLLSTARANPSTTATEIQGVRWFTNWDGLRNTVQATVTDATGATIATATCAVPNTADAVPLCAVIVRFDPADTGQELKIQASGGFSSSGALTGTMETADAPAFCVGHIQVNSAPNYLPTDKGDVYARALAVYDRALTDAECAEIETMWGIS